MNEAAASLSRAGAAGRTAVSVLVAISFCHLLNDMMQSLLPALYPMLKTSYSLTFGQIGILTFTYQITASLLQPIIGRYCGQQAAAVFARHGHGLQPGRARHARLGAHAIHCCSWQRR